MTETNKKYHDLLEALAVYYSQSRDGLLDAYLLGYAGQDWEAERNKHSLPDCRHCGAIGTTVHHADSEEGAEVLTCSNCGHTGYR